MYHAHTLGYSLISTADNYFGKLRPSQMHALFDGWGRHEKKQSDSVKKGGRSGGRVEATMSDLHKIPGVKILKKKK